MAANLPEAECHWHRAEELPLSFPAVRGCATQRRAQQLHAPAEDSGHKNIWLGELNWIFPRKSVSLCPFYRLTAEAQTAEGAWAAVHHQPWKSPAPDQHCIYRAAERSFACRALDFVQHWDTNTTIQIFFVCFLLTGDSTAILWGKPIFPFYFRGMFFFIVAWWSLWLRQSKKLLSALGLTSLKKRRNVLEKITTELSKPLGEKIPLPFSCQKWLISLIPSQLSKSYISAAELVQHYFFSRISQWMNKSLCIFSRGGWKSWICS